MSLLNELGARAFEAAERGTVKDPLIRFGIRWLVRSRTESLRGGPALDESTLRTGPIAPAPVEALEQHYEVPAAFFQLCLGPWRKYSSGYWPDGVTDLAGAEEAMLALTCERALLEDGQQVLDLGCGWGSLTLYAARRYPASSFVSVSHSHSQREFIESEARRMGLDNIRVITTDVSDLQLEPDQFDRVVSIEMFEHMNNYERLMAHIERWLKPGGCLFIHVFCHHDHAYRFETEGAGNWMAREFFTGGLMPSADLLPRFRGRLESEEDWFVPGWHYGRTSEAWLANLDRNRERVRDIFAKTYGEDAADRWIQRWRLFFLAVAETFAYGDGREWGLAHHRFRKPAHQPTDR